MKKVFLTAVVALSALVASAQFMVVTTYDGDQEENMDKIAGKLGVGFMVNDAITLGVARGGKDASGDDTYDLFARYNLNFVEGMYATIQAPTTDATDNLSLGAGVSFNVMRGLYIEPNYTMPANADSNGEREGSFNLGIAYRF